MNSKRSIPRDFPRLPRHAGAVAPLLLRLAQVAGEDDQQRIELDGTVPVHLVYWTAYVDRDGTLYFAPDLLRPARVSGRGAGGFRTAD